MCEIHVNKLLKDPKEDVKKEKHTMVLKREQPGYEDMNFPFKNNLRYRTVLWTPRERERVGRPGSSVWFFTHLWTVAHQAPLSMNPRQEYWSGLPFPSPVDLPDLGIELMSSTMAGKFFYHWATREAPGRQSDARILSSGESSV